MRAPRLSARDRRALALGALFLVPALLYALVARPFVASLSEARDRLAAERDLLGRELALVEAAEGFRGLAMEAGALQERATGRLLADEGGIPLTLEEYVLGRAAKSRVYVEQSDSREIQTESGLRVAQTDVRGVGDFQGILDLLYELENGPKLIHVERLSIEPVTQAPESGEERISVSFTATGFAVRAEARDSTATDEET